MKNIALSVVLALVVGLGLGYWYGYSSVYEKAYDKAVADIQAQQDEVAKKAEEEAAKTANPFQVENPLSGVSANPFDEAKSSLNPFSQ